MFRSGFHLFGKNRPPVNAAVSIHQAAMRPLCKACRLSSSYTCSNLAKWASRVSLSEIASICLTTNDELSLGS